MKNTRTLESQMRDSYLDYAMAVIAGRDKSIAAIKTNPSITNDMPESGGGGESAGVTDGPEVAASDDDGDSDDGDPDRRSRKALQTSNTKVGADKRSSLTNKRRDGAVYKMTSPHNAETRVKTTTPAGTSPNTPQNPDIALWRLPTVLAHIPVSKSGWWAGVASGRYPKPVKLSTRCVAWRSQDIANLIASF